MLSYCAHLTRATASGSSNSSSSSGASCWRAWGRACITISRTEGRIPPPSLKHATHTCARTTLLPARIPCLLTGKHVAAKRATGDDAEEEQRRMGGRCSCRHGVCPASCPCPPALPATKLAGPLFPTARAPRGWGGGHALTSWAQRCALLPAGGASTQSFLGRHRAGVPRVGCVPLHALVSAMPRAPRRRGATRRRRVLWHPPWTPLMRRARRKATGASSSSSTAPTCDPGPSSGSAAT